MDITQKILTNISVDCVIFGFDFERLNVVLVEREYVDPVSGETLIQDFSLAGYHIFEGEDLDDAAYRILKDRTGLENLYLEQFATFGNTDRLSREKDQLWLKLIDKGFADRVITIGYFALIDSTKVQLYSRERKTEWFPVTEALTMNLAFDHQQILHAALEALRKKVRIEPLAFELLPERFTLTQLQKLFEAITGKPIDKRNFRKKKQEMPFIVQLEEKQDGVAHRPARLFHFDREIFDRTRSEKLGNLF
jgi:8-oxo-dGTP diphosphatase